MRSNQFAKPTAPTDDKIVETNPEITHTSSPISLICSCTHTHNFHKAHIHTTYTHSPSKRAYQSFRHYYNTMSHHPPQNMRLLNQASAELESIRCVPTGSAALYFPRAARALLHTLPGNAQCMDCSAPHPTWASVTYGVLLCLNCSGKHRSYGVATSKVKSVDMDGDWSHAQVLQMLEGGNQQLSGFWNRHGLSQHGQRYHTKAARFYRQHLVGHVEQVADSGIYQGREAARQAYNNNNEPTTKQSQDCSAQQQQQQQQHCHRRQSIAVAQ